MLTRASKLERKATGITILVALQALVCAFFLVDLVGDIAADGIGLHLVVESMAAIALLIAAAGRDETAVAAGQGAMANLIRLRFEERQLTAAEADVALFALKGCDISEIAGSRGSAAGTVRAQIARVYSKAGVASQSGLIALYLEELIASLPRGNEASAA
jgi:DNA-binding CsgD family transcriptional regulator